MSLVECPDCGKQVSETAQTCINCGRVMKSQVMTIEKTGKRVKKLQLASAIAFFIGLLFVVRFDFLFYWLATFFIAIGISSEWAFYISHYGAFTLLWVGALGFVAASVLRWWHHE